MLKGTITKGSIVLLMVAGVTFTGGILVNHHNNEVQKEKEKIEQKFLAYQADKNSEMKVRKEKMEENMIKVTNQIKKEQMIKKQKEEEAKKKKEDEKAMAEKQAQIQAQQEAERAQQASIEKQAQEQAALEAQQAQVQQTQQIETQPVQEISTPVQSNNAKSQIAMIESTNNYNATNGKYIGKYQLDESYLNGDYSPENQERVADQYVTERYGSWDAALAFHNANGWY